MKASIAAEVYITLPMSENETRFLNINNKLVSSSKKCREKNDFHLQRLHQEFQKKGLQQNTEIYKRMHYIDVEKELHFNIHMIFLI